MMPRDDAVPERLLLDSPIGLAVVDPRYRIVVINDAARTLLGVHGVAVGEDLLGSASATTSEELRGAMEAACGGEAPAESELDIHDGRGEVVRTVRLTCQAHGQAEGVTPNVVLVLVDVTAEAARRRQTERSTEALRVKLEHLGVRFDQLTARQRTLLTANDELTSANVELRSDNLRLRTAADDAASAGRSVNALSAEMQATNVELERLNDELQATTADLNAAYDGADRRAS